MPASDADNSRFQFSIRSLLATTTICAVLFGAMRVFGVEPFVALLWAVGASLVVVLGLQAMQTSIIRAERADPNSPQTVMNVPNDFEASLVIDKLAAAQILARAVGGYTSGFQAEAPGQVQVVVAQKDADRAREVLADFKPDASKVDWSKVNTDADPTGD
jgi:hypothetical protein